MIRDTSAQDRPVTTTAPAPRLRRWALPAGGALLVLLLIAFAARGWLAGSQSIDSSRVRIAEVTRGDLVRDISGEGRVIAANSPTLYAIASGVVTLHVVAGDVVKKGQPLAEIDSPELRSKLAQEQTTLASMEAEASRANLDATLTRAQSRKLLDQARIEQIAAERDLQRYQTGYEGGAVPQIDVARAEDEVKKAQIGVAQANRDLSLQGQGAGLDARNKRLLADRQKAVVAEVQRQVDLLTIRSPFDGQVGQVQVQQRSSVALNGPVLSVVDLSVFEVEIKVPESFARDLAIGMPARLTSGSGEPYPGEVSAVSPEVVNGEVVARIRFSDKQPPGLRQNQRLSARVLLDTRKNVLMVERGPFVDQGGGRYAYVMDGSSARRTPIELGASSLSQVEVLGGLKEGDKVVVSGSDLFNEEPQVTLN
ncbi:efflux RND transporter periplasmic adaptor subunit [Pseudoxanthomonas dokdonensis]|uniref:ABC transporter permease n=1 Tax=Pseudoxanthomonas dokdonensis TaxID=344882 RepID=A0A0R0CZL2_9GAMM|nr:efflux RND transporter periplasmic adaptor subunit [Pseudoxanthomonas dokdonensis]KRG71630.1 ABC transporter permease [Pseudoxanthomonas dokdonensis]